MTDRVHPGATPADLAASEPLNPPPPPPPGYVIQIPKDQIYRVPPPENAYKLKKYQSAARRKRSRGCCCCLFYILSFLLILALLLGAAALAMYLVYRPKLPSYSVDSLTITGLDIRNATSTTKAAATPAFSPEFDAIVRASNPNGKISIDYRSGSKLRVLYSGVDLAKGSWPAFVQGTRNTTAVPVAMRGDGIRLSGVMLGELAAAQSKRAVPLWMAVEVPVRVRFGKATTWTVTVKARCDVTVDELTAKARVTAGACGAVKVKVF